MKNTVQRTYLERKIDDENEIKVSIEVHGYKIVTTKKILDHLIEELMKNVQLLQTMHKGV